MATYLTWELTISRIRGILAVTAGLVVIGGVVGAVLGVLAFAFMAIADGPHWLHTMAMFGDTAALFGAGVGAVLAPISAWTLMRHVPLWRAIVDTSVGTALGVIIGYFCGSVFNLGIGWPLALGVLGFLVAAIRLRLTAHRAERT